MSADSNTDNHVADRQTARARAPLEVFSEPELRDLQKRIEDSGALGRSRLYALLLDYLLNAAMKGEQPKEVEIAIDVMGRSTDFDVSRDSVVRVYIHQLRKRLKQFYERHEPDAEFRLIIPKGQYTIAVVPGEYLKPTPALPDAVAGAPRRPRWLRTAPLILIAALLLNAALLAANLLRDPRPTGIPASPVANHPMWQNIINDALPILVVMGDYYIFGELDDRGRVTRMIRDFNINSRQDLSNLFMRDSAMLERFMDLDMTYMPEGSAYALARIAPLLEQSGKPVNITMMSRLSTADLRNNHIVYIGYVSALDKLNSLYFAASALRIGRSYDELVNRSAGQTYTSDAGLPELGQSFRDVALLATFPAANNNQFVLISGTRDAGVMHSALAATNPDSLARIDEELGVGGTGSYASREAVFEVFGLDRMNFDANLLYAGKIEPTRIWSRE